MNQIQKNKSFNTWYRRSRNNALRYRWQNYFYVTNISDSNRRHIWSVDPATSNATILTKGNKIEYNPVIVNNGLVYLQASATKPSWPVFQSGGNEAVLAANLFPTNFPTNLVNPKTILVKATDGFRAPAQIFLPANYDASKKYPALIFYMEEVVDKCLKVLIIVLIIPMRMQ